MANLRRRSLLPNTRRRGNPGQNPIRQRMAPQPDQGQAMGGRPMDHMRRSLPNPQAMNQAMTQPSAQSAQGTQKPLKPGYEKFLDFTSPKDKAPGQGMTDQQVMWAKRNLLGRTGDVSGQEGKAFQNQLSKYIEGAGGTEQFQQMLAQMPGWQKRQVVPGGTNRMSANTYRPGGPVGGGGDSSRGRTGGIVNPRQPQQPQQPPGIMPQPLPPGVSPTGPRPQPVTSRPAPQPPQAMQQPQQPMQPQQQPMQAPAPQQAPQQPMQQQQPMRAVQPQMQATQAQASQPQAQVQAPDAGGGQRQGGGHRDPQRQQQRQQRDRQRFGQRGIPLTPEFEEGMRQLTDQYLEALIGVGYAEADAEAMIEQQKERLATDYGNSSADNAESLAGAGMLGSGQHMMQNQDVNTQYGRGFQDLATQAGQQQRSFADERAALLEMLRRGQQDLSLDATRQGVMDQYGGVNAGLPTSRRRGNKKGKRNGR